MQRTNRWTWTALALLAALGGCERPAEPERDTAEPLVQATPNCGDNGHLTTELYGSIARHISWSAEVLGCESMLRPDGKGVRLRFTGPAADSQIAIILALPELEPARTRAETPTVVTLTVEGSGRFFSTPTLESCWSDITTQDAIADSDSHYDVSGTLYCVAPLGEINGDAAISIPKLEFRGIIDWSAT